jgi:serine phosphatase RsbU (regulator of sigma subunit)
MRHFEPDAMATVLYAVFDQSLDWVRISSAGHLPPVIACPGQPAVTAEIPPDILLGITAQKPRQVTTVGFPPEALLCLYTDGLVERRGLPIDDGIARLCAAVTAEPRPPRAAVMGSWLAMPRAVTT